MSTLHAGIPDSVCPVCRQSERATAEDGSLFAHCSHSCRLEALRRAVRDPCRLAGCRRKVKLVRGSVTKTHEFCSELHGRIFERGAQGSIPSALLLPKGGLGLNWCGVWWASQETVADVEAYFKRQWAHGEERGTDVRVRSVLRIHNDAVQDRWEMCQDALVEEGVKPDGKHAGRGNSKRRFHGTTRLCSLGLDTQSEPALCSYDGCVACRIIHHGMRVREGVDGKFDRFGRALYFTRTSSKAHDYSEGSEVRGSKPHRRIRGMFIARVLLGKQYDLQKTAVDLDGPPKGFHSVYGKPGVDLNYDEYVVYSPSAALPIQYVTYEFTPPPEQ